jgi:hypothetical protein
MIKSTVYQNFTGTIGPWWRTVWLAAPLLAGNIWAQTLPDGPYFGQSPPGLTAEVFAPGIICLANRSEQKITWSPDGQECLIQTGSGLLYTTLTNGHWSNPTTPGFIGGLNLAEPFFSPDGQKIFFSGNYADLYVSRRTNQTWTLPQIVPSPVSTGDEEWHPTVTSDSTLYFCSSRNNPSGGYNIYRSRPVNGSYSTVEKLPAKINSGYGAWDPFIAPDESYLIFSTTGPGSYGKEDQYISFNVNSNWSTPRNLGSNINSSQTEYGSYISPDNKYYFFSRPTGSWDIYWVDARALGLFPQLVISPNGTSVTLSWSANFPDFALEKADQLEGPWTPVPGVTGYSATLPLGTTNQFFRLRK